MSNLCTHRRVEYPSPIGENWKIGCSCGWNASLPTITYDLAKELDKLFVEHVPEAERRTYVRVDSRLIPDPRDPDGESMTPAGNWLMPEGIPCVFSRFWGDAQEGFFVSLIEPVKGIFPVGEVFTHDGRIFRQD